MAGTGGSEQVERRHGQTPQSEPEESGAAAAGASERHERLSEDVDAILDEIDEVLEENAEEFVRAYVQKGGQ